MLSSASNVTKKAVNFLSHQNYVKKASGNSIDFSTIEITSKTVREKKVDITSTKIMLQKSCKKVHGNNVGFRPSKLRQKSTWKQRAFFDQRSYSKKARGNYVEIFQNLVVLT